MALPQASLGSLPNLDLRSYTHPTYEKQDNTLSTVLNMLGNFVGPVAQAGLGQAFQRNRYQDALDLGLVSPGQEGQELPFLSDQGFLEMMKQSGMTERQRLTQDASERARGATADRERQKMLAGMYSDMQMGSPNALQQTILSELGIQMPAPKEHPDIEAPGNAAEKATSGNADWGRMATEAGQALQRTVTSGTPVEQPLTEISIGETPQGKPVTTPIVKQPTTIASLMARGGPTSLLDPGVPSVMGDAEGEPLPVLVDQRGNIAPDVIGSAALGVSGYKNTLLDALNSIFQYATDQGPYNQLQPVYPQQ